VVTDVTTSPSDIDVAAIEAYARATAELGSELSASARYAGLGFDPDTGDLVDWSGEWRARDIEDMLDRDGFARAGEQALTLPLRGAPLTVKPGDGDHGEAELVNDTLANLADPVEDTIGQAAQAQIYRMTFLEKLWTVRDGRFTYDALAWRPPDSCAPLRDPASGRLTGFKQSMTWWGGRTAPGGKRPSWVTIPTAKACVFTHGKARNPIRGVSELQAAYRCYQDKQKIRFLWMTFLKGASIQRLVAETQAGHEADVAGQLAKLATGGVAAISNVTALHILNATDSGAFFKEALAYLDNEMLSSILAGFLGLTGAATAGRGSFALSKDQSDFFTQALDGTAREIAADLRAQVVRPLVVVNFGPAAVVPKVTLGPIARATAQEQMDFLKGLAAGPTGVQPPREFVDELVVQIAGYLDLDVDKVAAAVKAAAESAAATLPADGVTTPAAAATSGALGAGADIVQQALAGLAPAA
jgi:hypothetical protein